MKSILAISLIASAVMAIDCHGETSIQNLGSGDVANVLANIELLSTTGRSYTAQVFHRYTDIECEPNPMPTECKKSTLIITIMEEKAYSDSSSITYGFETSPEFDWRFVNWITTPKDIGGSGSELKIEVEKLEIFPPKLPAGDPIYVWAPYEIAVKAKVAHLAKR